MAARSTEVRRFPAERRLRADARRVEAAAEGRRVVGGVGASEPPRPVGEGGDTGDKIDLLWQVVGHTRHGHHKKKSRPKIRKSDTHPCACD
jgi:hypothetical protein